MHIATQLCGGVTDMAGKRRQPAFTKTRSLVGMTPNLGGLPGGNVDALFRQVNTRVR
jgi:hypothetical protein